jgi:S1-C subfamily serine protease
MGMTACSLMKSTKGAPVAGFALPASTVRWVVSCIIENGGVERAWVGAALVSVTPSLATFLGLPVSHGALITEVVPDGPAASAGLRGSEKTLCLGNRIYPVGGDIIVAMGRSDIRSDADVIRKLKEYKPGDTVLVSVYRGSRLIRLKVKLARKQ